MERRRGVICNSLLAPLRHFIQHLVKQDLFCFASAVGNARRSQFVGSFVKRRTASEASQRPREAEKGSLTLLQWRRDSGFPRQRVNCSSKQENKDTCRTLVSQSQSSVEDVCQNAWNRNPNFHINILSSL